LVRIEIAWEGTRDPPAAAKAVCHEAAVTRKIGWIDERPRSPCDDEQPGIAPRRRVERGCGQPAFDAQLVERAPEDAADTARCRQPAFDGDTPLDDEIRALERQLQVVEQPVQQVGGVCERDVRDDPERLVRERDRERVRLDDGHVRPAAAQAVGEPRVELDRDDAPCGARELRGQSTRARADVDDEVGCTDVRTGDDRGCEGTAAKEVAATRTGRPRSCAPTCHGKPASRTTSAASYGARFRSAGGGWRLDAEPVEDRRRGVRNTRIRERGWRVGGRAEPVAQNDRSLDAVHT